MSLLAKIAAHKRLEVAERKRLIKVAELERQPLFSRLPVSLVENLNKENASGIIAEFKRQSPSKGIINGIAGVEEVTVGYARAGASGLSVLTDSLFFGGTNEDLISARKANTGPILRKDFVIDEYQVIEAKAIGADVILLIAAILTPEETRQLASLACSLGLETILEVHGKEELGHLNEHISIVGVNNRNLSDFIVSLDISMSLAEFIPKGILKISESGIHSVEDMIMLKNSGYNGFLIGEQFMSTSNPGQACKHFIQEIKRMEG